MKWRGCCFVVIFILSLLNFKVMAIEGDSRLGPERFLKTNETSYPCPN